MHLVDSNGDPTVPAAPPVVEGPRIKTRLRPRNGLVTVRILPKPTKTAQGIYLPDGNLGMMFERAEVVEVGPGVLLDSPLQASGRGAHGGTDDLKPGMKVLVKTGVRQDIGREMRSMIDFDDNADGSFGLLNQADILGILDEEEIAA